MDDLQGEELRNLMEETAKPCASFYLPTRPAGNETQQNPIRLKNLLRQGEDKLLSLGFRVPQTKKFLGPVQRLLLDGAFWRCQREGLAIFLSSEIFRFYRLPAEVPELVVIEDRFYLKPLLPLLSDEGRFFILALSQNQVRLLEGSRHRADEIDLRNVPQSLVAALQFDGFERCQQYHTRASRGRGKGSAIFHGQADPEDCKDQVLRFFRQIDHGLHELLRGKRAPLVLAGVDYLFPIYRESNTYPYLVEKGIPGNPEGLSPEELHGQAWPIVQLFFQADRDRAWAQYRQLAGTGRTSCDIEEIAPASYFGRVEALFIAPERRMWGIFDRVAPACRLHDQPEPGDKDLLDFSAIQTFLNGGMVYALQGERIPQNNSAAAVFRF
ncbi:MAG: hypothetical protein HY697_00640 [Deltaproteobacteria bacterium]|nr:hypothetical protein [Deltaproteobacteria bacterium]